MQNSNYATYLINELATDHTPDQVQSQLQALARLFDFHFTADTLLEDDPEDGKPILNVNNRKDSYDIFYYQNRVWCAQHDTKHFFFRTALEAAAYVLTQL